MRYFLYYNFKLIFAIDGWVRRRFTLVGKIVLSSIIITGVFGIDTRQTLAYQLFALFFTLVCLSLISIFFHRLRFTVKRELPFYIMTGETLQYRVTVYNHTPYLQANLQLIEDLKQLSPSYQDFIQQHVSVSTENNWFDNYVGYPRWLEMLLNSKGAINEPASVPTLPPNSYLSVMLSLHCIRRGYIYFEGATLVQPDILGICNSLHSIKHYDKILVLPHSFPVKSLNLSGSRRFQQGGINLAISVGDAEEFVSLREYRPGDPLRNIHWKSMARLGKPVIKEYQDEFFVRYALILDTFIDKKTAARFESAVSIAASFASAPRNHESLLDLMFVGTEEHCFTSGRGVGQVDKLLEVLACVQAKNQGKVSNLLPLLKNHVATLSGCVCILLAWDEERQQIVDFLRRQKLDMLIIVLADEIPNPIPEPFLRYVRPAYLAEDMQQF